LQSGDRVDRGITALGAWLLPWRCVLCAGAGAGRDLCARCAATLPDAGPGCARCGVPLAAPAAACGACLRRPPRYAALAAAFRYAWPLDRLVQDYKFAHALATGAVLAALLAERFATRVAALDLIVPVPLARPRLAARGFNQALELARPVARASGTHLVSHALVRTRDAAPQSTLASAARRAAVRGAFRANAEVVGARVALLDDVVTTGATADACARALVAAGAKSVEVYALARAAPPRAQPAARSA